jgi:hypothetical protein
MNEKDIFLYGALLYLNDDCKIIGLRPGYIRLIDFGMGRIRVEVLTGEFSGHYHTMTETTLRRYATPCSKEESQLLGIH